jgi:hypothetical protein
MPLCPFKGAAFASREKENMLPRSRMKGEVNFMAPGLDSDVSSIKKGPACSEQQRRRLGGG